MQDLNDKITGNTLSASEWNEVPSEIQNVIEEAGIVLSGADLAQLKKSIKILCSENNFYTVGGTANAVTLTSQSTTGHTAYFNGMTVNFITTTANTAAVTVNVDGLGAKSVKEHDASEMNAGEFVGLLTLVYDGTDFIKRKDNPPISNNLFFQSLDNAGTGTVDLIKADTSDNIELGNSSSNLDVVFNQTLTVDDGTITFLQMDSATNNDVTLYYGGGEVFKTQSATASDNVSTVAVKDAFGNYKSVGFNVMPPFEFSTTNEILTQSRCGEILEYSGTGGHSVTTEDSTDDLDIPVGATWMISNIGTSTLAINEGTSVTLRWLDGGGSAPSTGNRTLAIAGICTVTKISDAEYRIFGAGLS